MEVVLEGKVISVKKTKHPGIFSVGILVKDTDGYAPMVIFTKREGFKVDGAYKGTIRANIAMGSEPDVVWPRKEAVKAE